MEAPDIQVDSELQDFKEQDEDGKNEDISELAEDSKPEDLKEHSNNETPQSTGETPESTEETPESTAETPESMEETPQSTEETPQSTEETPESVEEPPQSTGETPQSMEETPESKADNKDDAPENMEELPQSMGETPQNMDETPQSMDETPQSKDDSKDVAPQSKDKTPQQQYQEEDTLSSLSRSSEKSSLRSRTSKMSSIFTTQPSSISPIFRFTSANEIQEIEESPTQSESELLVGSSELLSDFGEISSSAWEEAESAWEATEYTHEISIPIYSAPVRKRSFHDCCCSSVVDQMILHSPEHCGKASSTCTSVKKQQASSVKTKQLSSQKTSASITKKKECKAISKVQQPPTTSSFSFKESFKRSGRKSKALYNLYTTFCDEGDDFDSSVLGEKGSLLTHGLTRACTIFSFIKNGKINAQNLLLTLHMLGIMMTVPEVQKVLKLIAMDEYGNLEFADFLRIVNEALPFLDTKAYCSALQIAQEIFRKIKKEMVCIEDLEPTLAALGVVLCPNIINRALKRIRVTWDGKLNIADFLLTVNGPLSSHSRVASLNECANLERRSKLGLSESRPQSALEKEMHPHASVTFYDADQEFALDQFRKGSSESQRSSTDTKRPKTALLLSADEEEKDKVSHTVEWPKVRPTFGYSSQDTLFPLTTSLSKEEARKFTPKSSSWSPGQDYELASVMQMRMRNAALEQKKKKTLSFPEDLPRRYDTEDNEKQKSDSGSAKSEGKEGSGGLSVEQFAKGGS